MHNSSLNPTQAACNLGFIFNAHPSLSQIKSYHSPNSAVIILTDFAASAIIFISKLVISNRRKLLFGQIRISEATW